MRNSLLQGAEPLVPPSSRAAEELQFRLRAQVGFRFSSDLRTSLSPSGRYLVVGGLSEGVSLSVWDLATGYSVGETSALSPIAVFLDDRHVLYPTVGALVLWDLATGEESPLTLSGSYFSSFLALSPGGELLVVNDEIGDLRFFEVRRADPFLPGKRLPNLRQVDSATGLRAQAGAFLGDGTLLLGTAGGELLRYDISRKKVLSTVTVTNRQDLFVEVQGDFLYQIMKTLKGGLFGVRRIAVSQDGRRYAVLCDDRITLLADGEEKDLRLLRTLEAEKPFESMIFAGHHLLALGASGLAQFDRDGLLLEASKLPASVGNVTTIATVVGESRLLLAGPRALVAYDTEHRTTLRLQDGSNTSEFLINQRLLDEDMLLFYSQEGGLRRTGASRLQGALGEGSNQPLLELLYRSGLAGPKPAGLLESLNRFQDVVFWIETHPSAASNPDAKEQSFLFYLVHSRASRPRVRWVKMPETFVSHPAEKSSQAAFESALREVRVRRDSFHVDFNFGALSSGLFSDVPLMLRNLDRLACNGKEAAFMDSEGLAVLSLADNRFRHLAPGSELAKVAFLPGKAGHLVVAGRAGGIEEWDLAQELIVQSVPLPFDGEVDRVLLARPAR